MIADSNRDLYPCPCCPATQCDFQDPCLGCEVYSEWLTTLEEN